ncbi:tetratricopeptide repeat protein [Candidatus Parcubacteria bacterium]|nr:MAG: tetratricopeptide repeat protein [Candidatus Parcubacteria bacterium]
MKRSTLLTFVSIAAALIIAFISTVGVSPAVGQSPAATPSPTPQLSLEEWIQRGQEAFSAEDFHAAVDAYQAALQQAPDNIEALLGLGDAFFNLEEYEQAKATYEAVLALDPENVAGQAGMCRVMAWLEPDTGVTLCTSFLDAHPQDAGRWLSLGIAYMNQSDYQHAAEAFETAVQLDPGDYWGHLDLAEAYIKLDRFEDALAEAAEAIQIDPDRAEAYFSRGKIYSLTNQLSKAVTDYQKVVNLDPFNAEGYLGLGATFYDMGDFGTAIGYLEKFLALSPDDPRKTDVQSLISDIIPAGTYIRSNEKGISDEMMYVFIVAPKSLYEVAGDQFARITVFPQTNQDIMIQTIDESNGQVVSEMDEAGPGGEETVFISLHQDDKAIGMFSFKVTNKDNVKGDYQVVLNGTSAIGFELFDEAWEIYGKPGENTIPAFFALSPLQPQDFTFVATPADGNEHLDLAILVVNANTGENLGMVNDTGVGEGESARYPLVDNLYYIFVADLNGQTGDILFTYQGQ